MIEQIVQFVIIGFAGWRLASLISTEEGPKSMFCRFREFVAGFEHDENGAIVSHPNTNLARGLSCVWCSGVWTSTLAYGVWTFIHPAPVVIMAAAGLAVLIEQTVRPAAREIKVVD